MSKLVYLNKGSKGCTAAMPSKTCKKSRANIKPFEQRHSYKSTICCNKSSFISSLCQEIGTVNIIRECMYVQGFATVDKIKNKKN